MRHIGDKMIFSDLGTVEALADWEYIKSRVMKGRMNDPFILTTERKRDLTLLKEVRDDALLISRFDEDFKNIGTLPAPRDKDHPNILFSGSQTAMNKKEELESFLQRLTMAATGEAFLITPMLIIVLKSLLTTFLTTSLCVVAFGFVPALHLDKLSMACREL